MNSRFADDINSARNPPIRVRETKPDLRATNMANPPLKYLGLVERKKSAKTRVA
jgi:hypothetical protein